ncbi:MAG: lytic transglycosylase domain-containing protein [Sphingobium sp.]|nr:lytic transglycosylase domain-containing protein [Sphingobium sp.]MBP6111444.1 lytic transglycosylase domain-containing protein [Sphingobium sp.]MBP8670144.1 lytic transglycosylase domain-containing protein [Sphingobium sp.]MBP9157351.1 lytic transglycosylase domain-containing protein [Sphingobium sp.]MCC6481942.1 lytic transglycosylase domain-containing protein [Sphingomonadaceae bacterium]
MAIGASTLAFHAGTALAEPTLVPPQNMADAQGAVSPLSVQDTYRATFAALRAANWAEVKTRIGALDKDDPVRAVALATLYTAKNSPKTELFDILDLMNKASWLPHAEQLSRMAKKRGAELLPDGPQVQKLVWLGAAPRRQYTPTVREDAAAQALVAQIQPYIKADTPGTAEALITPELEVTLSPDGLAEARQRVAWAYYIGNDDGNALRLASRAVDTGSSGDWVVQAQWTIGLAHWRQQDARAAAVAFEQVAGRASNDDMRAAGSYWAARAWMNAGQPGKVAALLKRAAQRGDTFYGMLARETLGIEAPQAAINPMRSAIILDKPAVKAALALHDIGENDMADQLLRHQAAIGTLRDYDSLLALTDTLDLPTTQIWLAQRGPAGHNGGSFGRFPRPSWTPDGGWRVDPALVFAHALQESGFRTDAVSPAGARGLMQVMPGTARLVAGESVSAVRLSVPSTNMEYGQRYLEQLRDMKATGGLLPKVMAAYNAGPAPVERWNSQVRDNGDPLLFMESLPYYETRAYVNIVMRNYWMYELRADSKAEALTAMAQGKWPAFPTIRNGKPVQLSYRISR